MKSTQSASKTRQSQTQTKSSLDRNDGQLFLGHKVLGELRILMRLATPNGTAASSAADSNGRSY